MKKEELIAAVAEKSGLTKKDAGAAIKAVVETITAAVAEGDKVQLVGFGTFELREHGEKQGVNPKTGEKMVIPAGKTPAFKPGKSFKDLVK